MKNLKQLVAKSAIIILLVTLVLPVYMGQYLSSRLVSSTYADALVSTNVEPASLIAGATSTATVTFTTVNPISANGKIKVTFGAGFNVTGVGASDGTCSSMDGTFVTSVVNQTVIMTRQGDGTEEAAGAETCAIANLANPSSPGPTGIYDINITNNTDATIDQDNAVASDNMMSIPVCGNDLLDQGEECDDGNTTDSDGCSAVCVDEVPGAVCGNNIWETGEQCDDGNTADSDGCSGICEAEAPPPAVCGNGVMEQGEQCDDGNTADSDGCSSTCQNESQPSAVCGNGVMEQGEQCDDSNTISSDGCSATCQLEPMTGGVTGVTGADNDTSFYGLDGDDFTVTWTPAESAPIGYNGTQIYILPDSVSVDSTNVMTTACSNNPCAPVGFFFQYTQNSHTLPPFMNKDSSGVMWNAATDYKACVLTQAAVQTLDCSSAFNVTSDDSVSDTMPPFIMHMPLHTTILNSGAVLHAFVDDDQAVPADFTDSQTTAIAKMYYGSGFTTEANAVAVPQVDGLFVFSTAAPITDPTFNYYLTAQDNATPPNVMVFTNNPGSTSANASSSPITAQVVAAGSRSISGTIRDFSNNPLENAYVFLAGYGKVGVVTNSSGAYTINNIPDGAYDIFAGKTGYCQAGRFEVVSGNLTNIDLELNEGSCQFFGPPGGPGGDGGKPFIMFTGPPEGSPNVPPDEDIRMGLSQTMNAQTINDANSSATTDNIYLIGPDGNVVPGTVTYCPDKNAAGCSSLYDMDTNTILFQPTSSLVSGPHTLVVKGIVTSESGQSIEGNRPGGGHNLNFHVGGGEFDSGVIGTNFGNTGQYMPPFVMSMLPSPFQGTVPPNTNIMLEFNEPMKVSTLTTDNIKLIKFSDSSEITTTVTVDNNTQQSVTITPSSALASGEYELRVLANVANGNGISMLDPGRPNASNSDVAFSSIFEVGGSTDTQAPNIYPFTAGSAVDVPVNIGEIEFGFSEPMNGSTFTASNVTLKRGNTAVSKSMHYDSGINSLFVVPNSVLAPNTTYTITFNTNVTDISGVALASETSFSFTTAGSDNTAPEIIEARCDDYSCFIRFNEQMNNDISADSDFAGSVINHANLTLTSGGGDLIGASTTLIYNMVDSSVKVEGLALTIGQNFTLTVEATATDLSGNAINTTGGANVFMGPIEDSAMTFGSFDNGGMFGPPVFHDDGAGFTGATEFKPEGFGNFTAEQFMFGEVVEAFPFSNMAGGDVNVFQVRIPVSQIGSAIQNGDQLVLTFPKGTGIANTVQDEFSPFRDDFNQGATGIITFDNTFDTDGISVNASTNKVTVQMAVTGSPSATDFLTMDLRGITNPPIPKGPESGGYTVGIKVMRAGSAVANLTSMPYFISGAGTNSITVKVYAGIDSNGTAGADGNVFLFGGGPAGPMDKNLTLTNGIVTAADATAIAGDAGVVYNNLPDGCYNIGTDPFATFGGNDYFGQSFPEPICVFGGENKAKTILLLPASGGGSVPVTVKINHTGGGFGGTDIDIFAGGPGRFVVKTLTNVDVPNPNGYTINLPENGFWHVGVGPAAPKGSSAGPPDFEAFGAMPPPPIDLEVKGLPTSGSVKSGFNTPQGVAFNDSTDTVTFTVRSSNIEIPVRVTDGTNGLNNIDVFMHQQGFGGGAFGMTDSNGDVTLKVADYGPYEIGAFMPGLGDTFKQIEIRNESGTKIYMDGVLVTTVPLKLLKSDYTISGKVLDADGEPIPFAPVWAEDSNGRFVPSGTGNDGSYTLFVSAGTWTLYSDLPPDKTSICGTFQKTVVITTASKSNQNITPSNSTCYTLSGTVTIGGNAQANSFVFVESWDTINDRPSGGFHRGVSTDSTGAYNAKVPTGTYRVGTFDPDFGELSEITTVATANKTLDLSSGTLGNITFAFTGGAANMDGFIEIKKSDDRHIRFGKPFNGADENVVISVKEGTYKYMVDIFGIGNFNGTATTGNTVTIDLSASAMITFSGTIHDVSDNPLPNATVALHDFDNGIDRFVQTDSNGDYSLEIKSGEYEVEVNRAGYVAPAATVALTENTADYDFGGTDTPEKAGLTQASKSIEGTVLQSDGTTPVTDGFVWAEDSAGHVVSAPVDPIDGTYKLNVTEDTAWTVSAAAPLHDETDFSTVINTTDVTADTGKDITLTANTAKVPKSKNASINVSTGGTVDDMNNTGMRMVAAGGALDTGQGTANVSMKKSFKAPKTENFIPLDQTSFELNVTDSSDQAIKDFSGNVELTFNCG
jgi:cysteine-rich repeat protein